MAFLTMGADIHRDAAELPAVDLFVTTADVVLEPPIMTVNTIAVADGSLLSCSQAIYVSDD
ncbi:hypothetical protein TIFTF001_041648 [Ficus carica]|uniref:Uncharacterized protein n=1 Tax=Ficus carica TaxID=3494 RepID=A0AA88CVW8_FICCA|nr:hypothetical protein TIFTF001_041648 [Ficus carica]